MGNEENLFDDKTRGIATNAEVSERPNITQVNKYILRQFWQSFVDDGFDLENAIQTKAVFSCAIVVMDKIGGWEG